MPKNKITLFILSTRQRLSIEVKDRVVLGRSAGVEEDGTLNVDLSPFMAYQLGVSRRHLMLMEEDGDILAFDLSSRNGSFINGDEMTSRKGYPLQDGDELALGSLNIRVYVSQEVPYLDMQTRQLPRLEEVTQSRGKKDKKSNKKPDGITSPLPDIRSTLSESTMRIPVKENSLETEEHEVSS